MKNWADLLAAWPFVLIVVLTVVMIRSGRHTRPSGDTPPDHTAGGSHHL